MVKYTAIGTMVLTPLVLSAGCLTRDYHEKKVEIEYPSTQLSRQIPVDTKKFPELDILCPRRPIPTEKIFEMIEELDERPLDISSEVD